MKRVVRDLVVKALTSELSHDVLADLNPVVTRHSVAPTA